MEVLLMAILSVSNILCFVIGAKIGQTIVNGEKVEMANLNPIKPVRVQRRKAANAEDEKMAAVLRNIERYDGTSKGQEDVN